jgi:outer membrane protein W
MKKLLIVVLAMVLVFGLVSAQDINPAIHSGAKSLNFTFGGLGAFGLGASGLSNINFFAPGFGASYFLSNDAALRIGFQVAFPSAKSPANPPAGKPGTDATESAFSLGVGGDYLMYMGSSRVRPFVGAGLYFATNSTDEKNGTGTGDGTGFVQTETKNDVNGVTVNGTTYLGGTNFGIRAIMGAEFFIYNELSMSAEYDLNILNIASQSDQVVTRGSSSVTTKSPSSTTILGFGAAGATLHIYF